MQTAFAEETEQDEEGADNLTPASGWKWYGCVRDQDLSVSEVSRSRDLVKTAVRYWVAQYDAEHSGGAGEGKSLTAEQQRIRQLDAENRQLREDNALPKKRRPSLPGN
ncbi:transposase [Paraburkholderia sp. BL18I3N2]|uniref:transposase n=1 Tax=Paraburkholderia sp. BL18I3N2 TaxID=1938799 RepID=UPI0011B2324A